MPLARHIKDVLKMDAFTKSVGLMPLITVEKVGESNPVPFTPNPQSPLDGIASARYNRTSLQAHRSVRAMALQWRRRVNVWRPSDVTRRLLGHSYLRISECGLPWLE